MSISSVLARVHPIQGFNRQGSSLLSVSSSRSGLIRTRTNLNSRFRQTNVPTLRSSQHRGFRRDTSFARQFAPTISSRSHTWDEYASSLNMYRRRDTIPADENSTPQILCTSASALLGQEESFLLRLFHWLRRVFLSCYDALVLSFRGAEITLRLIPLAVMTPASVLCAQFLDTERNVVSHWTWNYVTASMQALGPGFVKLCQWVATRRDIFPPHVCDRLSMLHDNGHPHAWKHTHSMLTEAFGDYRAKGLDLSPESPVLGCGSAAQVYKASFRTTEPSSELYSSKKENNQETERSVAVKILHPRFEALVERDLWLMQSVADLFHSLPVERIRMLNLPRATSNFASVLRRQADLRVEGENLTQFRKNFYGPDHDESTSAILFPKPMEGWSSRNVLVEDLVEDATPISDFLQDSSVDGVRVRKELAAPLLRAFLKMVFLDNFVHSDLHPGNVLVQTSYVEPDPKGAWEIWRTQVAEEEGTEVTIKRRIVFLDAGIATSLNPEDKRNLRDLFRSVILNDGYEAGRLMVERAKYERCSHIEGGVEAFASGVGDIVSEFHDRRKEGLTLGAVRIGSLLSRVLDLCRLHGVEIDPAMASIVISTLVLEGLGRSLEPSLNLLDFSIPFVIGRGKV